MLSVKFNESTETLTISGSGNLNWRDIIAYAEKTKHIVIEGTKVSCDNASNLFSQFCSLIDIIGSLDTSKCEDFSFMYAECFALVHPVQDLDTSSGREFDFMHSDNHSIKEVHFNSTSNGVRFGDMFYGCTSLEAVEGVTIPSIDYLESISNIYSIKEQIKVK